MRWGPPLLLVAALFGMARLAGAEPEEVEIGGGHVYLLRLAVPDDGVIGEVLRGDARMSGGFWEVPFDAIPVARRNEPAYDKAAWAKLGAMAVIKNSRGGKRVTFDLYDLAKGQAPVLTRTYSAAEPRTAAHRFMNDVIAYYTQVPGVFGSRIAFERTTRGRTVAKNIHTMDSDGAAHVAVTDNRVLDVLPSIGPGGQVLFTSYGKRNPDLWIAHGGKTWRASRYPGLNLGGVVSPDGRAVALALSKDGNSELYTIGLDGSVKRRLTKNRFIDGSPTWRRDAASIAFVSDRTGAPQIFRVAADGGAATRVTTRGRYNQSPDWNPGLERYGDLIAYASREAGRMRVRTIDVGTGKDRAFVDAPGDQSEPTWSPDGRMLAFVEDRHEIVVVAERANPVKIATGTAPDWGPARPR